MKPKLKTFVDYFQPDFYHFSQDSIFLVQKVLNFLQKSGSSKPLHCLDLCAGCGVVGLEMVSQSSLIKAIDFVEIQSNFRLFFEQNKKLILGNDCSLPVNYFIKPLSKLDEKFHKRYDLIVCNPPYFEQGRGRLSDNHQKNCCRFFINDSFKEMVMTALRCLNDEGVFFFLSRDSYQHCQSILRELIEDDNCLRQEGVLAETSVYSIRCSSAYK